MKTLPHDFLDRISLAQAEHNYVSGAASLVQQEIAETKRSIYHKPGGVVDWAAEHMGPARRTIHADEREDDDWNDNIGRPIDHVSIDEQDEPVTTTVAGNLGYTRRIK